MKSLSRTALMSLVQATTHDEIPKSVIFIGHSAFAGCNNLNVVIDNSKDSVKIEEDAFKECKSVRYTRLIVDD